MLFFSISVTSSCIIVILTVINAATLHTLYCSNMSGTCFLLLWLLLLQCMLLHSFLKFNLYIHIIRCTVIMHHFQEMECHTSVEASVEDSRELDTTCLSLQPEGIKIVIKLIPERQILHKFKIIHDRLY